jgi:hypothetical protein
VDLSNCQGDVTVRFDLHQVPIARDVKVRLQSFQGFSLVRDHTSSMAEPKITGVEILEKCGIGVQGRSFYPFVRAREARRQSVRTTSGW